MAGAFHAAELAKIWLKWRVYGRTGGLWISPDAKAHFDAGVSFLQDPDGARHEEAYREFKAAYAASPSWKLLGNLGITAMKLERDREAIAAFEAYLAEGGAQIEAEERSQFERDLATLRAGVVSLELDAGGGTVLDERFTASGATAQNSYGAADLQSALGLRPGRHRFTARAAGKAPAVWEVELSPKQQASHQFTYVPEGATADNGAAATSTAEGGSNGLRIGSYVALGVGAVGIGLGTVFALKSKSAYDDGNELCPSFPCQLTSAEADEREQYGKDGDSAADGLAFGIWTKGVTSGFELWGAPFE